MATREEVIAARVAAMSEKALNLKVRGLLNDLGLAPFSFHPTDGVGRMRAGWPDWTIVGTRLIFREEKTEKGRLSDDQKLMLAHLEAVGYDVGIWRPSDLYSGRIASELAAIADSTVRARAAGLTELAALRKAKAKAAGRRPGGSIARRRAA